MRERENCKSQKQKKMEEGEGQKQCTFKGVIDATLNCAFRLIQRLNGFYHLRNYF
jgi:hypothetical protein